MPQSLPHKSASCNEAKVSEAIFNILHTWKRFKKKGIPVMAGN